MRVVSVFWTELILFPLLSGQNAFAVVDANSESNTNAPTDGAPWGSMGQVNGSGGIYLGAGWVLTPAHVGAGDIYLENGMFLWDGTYHWLTNSDGTFADVIMFRLKTPPPLPRLPLVSSTPSALSAVDMIGYGYRSGSSATSFGLGVTGFYWSNTQGKSWGNNKVNAAGPTYVDDKFTNVVAFATDFDSSTIPGQQTSNEAQAAPGDSGGGVFFKNGANWELAGMIVAIDHSLTNRPSNTAVYTDQTYSADIATYRPQILSFLQSTIPSLSIAATGTNIQVSWLDTGVNYDLQATTSISSPNWSVLSPNLTTTNGQICALLPSSSDSRFFRLQKK